MVIQVIRVFQAPVVIQATRVFQAPAAIQEFQDSVDTQVLEQADIQELVVVLV